MTPRLALIVPCYNESDTLPLSAPRLSEALRGLIATGLSAPDSRIIFIDDGSNDSTWAEIEEYCAADTHIGGIRLAANAGHQNALIAGLEETCEDFDVFITLDADLQDDISVLPEMLTQYLDHKDIVYGVRRDRSCDTPFKRMSAHCFYRLMQRLGIKTVYDHADFRLMSRRAVRQLLRFRESNLFLRGIVPSLGYPHAIVEYARQPRICGTTKYPLKRMLNFTIEGITSFSVRPVRMVFSIGLLFLIVALAILVYVLIRFFNGETIEGWTSLILSIWFCTAVLLICMGIIGEYIGKIYMEVKHRPRYTVEKTILRQ